MHLSSPDSAILSAVVFNALIIIALIPLALRGVRYRPASAAKLLSRNLWIYGLGGIVVPFVGIKLPRPAHLPHPRDRVITVNQTLRQGWVALRLLLVMTVVLGIAYPFAMFAVGRIVSDTSDGSYVTDASGAVVGSALIGQSFAGEQWFWPRPSAAGDGYDALSQRRLEPRGRQPGPRRGRR